MLYITTKLIDKQSSNVVGVVCKNGNTSVALSLEKAKELGIQDIDIIQYLGVNEEYVFKNPKRKNYIVYISNNIGELDNFSDIPYEFMGDRLNLFDCKEVIYGYIFNYMSFIELDNAIALQRALVDFEKDE